MLPALLVFIGVIVTLAILLRPRKMPEGFGEWHAKNVARHFAETHNLPWRE